MLSGTVLVCPDFEAVLEACRECAVIAVDMPIGLPSVGCRRPCDGLARQRLGKRASSVFSAPPREFLGKSFAEISGFSLQSFNLFRRIAEVDSLMTPELQARVRETHPELVWTRLLGHPPLHGKRTPEGRAERLALLPREAGADPPRGAARDDLVDAWGLWLSASDRRATVLGGELDDRGLRMEIWS